MEYHKIQTVFNRNPDTKYKTLLMNEWSRPEFEYLANNQWTWQEKIDGTNIRVQVNELGQIKFGGRTDNSQIPATLVNKLHDLFPYEKVNTVFRADCFNDNVILYGEGFGAKIQKGGGNYISDGVDFILFDVLVDNWWLKREDVEDIAEKLEIRVVPIVGTGTLYEAVKVIQAKKTNSVYGDFLCEGFVMRPAVELKDRAGKRIITKIKHKDFA